MAPASGGGLQGQEARASSAVAMTDGDKAEAVFAAMESPAVRQERLLEPWRKAVTALTLVEFRVCYDGEVFRVQRKYWYGWRGVKLDEYQSYPAKFQTLEHAENFMREQSAKALGRFPLEQ